MGKIGRPSIVASVGHDRNDANTLTPLEALETIKNNDHELFPNEHEYRTWFIDNVLERLSPHIASGGMVDEIWQEKLVFGSRLRIDVLATTDNGYVLGFELKSVNPRYRQNHAREILGGVGQVLLYEDVLREQYGNKARVFLVSDSVTERAARLIMRHDYLINLVEANQKTITCIAREEIGRE